MYQGLVVRLTSNTEVRKPFLRVDLAGYFPPGIVSDAIMVERLGGAEAVVRGLGNLPPVEEIEVDQNFSQDTAEEAIQEAFRNSRLPASAKVRFSSFRDR